MARPKRLKTPVKLNLLIEQKTKRRAFKMACEKKVSVGRLFEMLLDAESPMEATK